MGTNKPIIRQQWIFDLLKVETYSYLDMWAKYRQTWAKGKTTFDKDWNIANDKAIDYKNLANKAKDEATIAVEVEAVKNGLKSKLEKQIHLQKEIDAIQSDIDAGVMVDYYYADGIPTACDKEMNAETKAYLRKTIKDLYAELNKMEGNYAPTKVANTDTEGKTISQTFTIMPIAAAVSLIEKDI